MADQHAPSTVRMWPELHWRLDAINPQHAHVTVFDHGQRAGQLTLARGTWDLLTRYRVGADVPEPSPR